MSDAATAAPSTSSAPTGATPSPASGLGSPAASSATSAPVGGGSSPTRGADGKFLPKAGDVTATQPPAPVGETSAQAEKRRLKFKANGRDVELDEDEVIRRLQIGEGTKAKFTELDQQRKEFEARLAMAKEDPREYLRSLGMSPEELAFSWLNEHVTQQEMSPEQKRALDLDAREAKIRESEAARQAEAAEAEQKQAMAQLLPIIQEHGPKALEAAGLPMIPAVVDAFHGYMQAAAEAMGGITPEGIKYAADAAKQDATELHAALTKSLDGAALVAFLGPEVADKLRRHDLKVFHEKRAASKGVATPAPRMPAQEPKPTAPKYITEAEWRRSQKGMK